MIAINSFSKANELGWYEGWIRINLGVMVRPTGAFGAANKVRVTIGTSANNQAFINAYKSVMRS